MDGRRGETGWLAVRIVRIACIAGGVALLVAGLAAGGFLDVMLKGVRICLECIGLG